MTEAKLLQGDSGPIAVPRDGTLLGALFHLHWLRDEMGDELRDAVVVTTGPYAYRRLDGVAVVPLALLGP